jgi:peroxiredoxin
MPILRSLPLSVLIIGLILAGCSPAEPGPDKPAQPMVERGRTDAQPVDTTGAYPAPDFSIPVLDGGQMSLADQRGNVLLVNFWATWCAPCIQEIPDLIELHERYESAGFAVLGISTDDDGAEVVRPFVRTHGIIYPILLDDGSAADAFGNVYGLPTTFLIDRNGRVLSRFMGLLPVDRYEPLIRDLLGVN